MLILGIASLALVAVVVVICTIKEVIKKIWKRSKNEKIKDLEYICIGANTYDVHSPKERVSIKSMKETWEYIKQIISKK